MSGKSGPRGRTILQRFWTKIEITPECWVWKGYCQPNGYGRFSYSVKRAGFAHRLSYELFHGAIPFGRHVLHHCDNPPCVNPAHLFLGTAHDNILDAVAKGRWHGTRPGQGRRVYRLGAEARESVRTEYSLGGISQQALAKRYDVSQTMISRTIRHEGLR